MLTFNRSFATALRELSKESLSIEPCAGAPRGALPGAILLSATRPCLHLVSPKALTLRRPLRQRAGPNSRSVREIRDATRGCARRNPGRFETGVKYPRQESNDSQETLDKLQLLQLAAQKTAHIPQDLATVVDGWPSLPEPIRAGIVAMVRAATGSARVGPSTLSTSTEPQQCLKERGFR